MKMGTRTEFLFFHPFFWRQHALGILYGVYKFAPQQQVKAMALGVAGIIVAKQVPILKDQV